MKIRDKQQQKEKKRYAIIDHFHQEGHMKIREREINSNRKIRKGISVQNNIS